MRRLANHFLGICGIYLQLLNKVRKTSAWNRWHLETHLDLDGLCPKISPDTELDSVCSSNKIDFLFFRAFHLARGDLWHMSISLNQFSSFEVSLVHDQAGEGGKCHGVKVLLVRFGLW